MQFPLTRNICLLLGALILLFAVRDLFAPRARFLSSNPAPGASLSSPPAAVIVSLGNKLSPASEITVVSNMTLSQSGKEIFSGGTKVSTTSGIDPADPKARTLKADLQAGLGPGLYRVDWRSVAADGNAESFGRYYFGAEMSLPENITREMGGAVRERDPRWRGRSSALLVGTLLIVIGAFRMKTE